MVSKQDLVDYIVNQTMLSRLDASQAVDALVDSISYYLSRGEKIHILNFGTFETHQHAAKISYDIHLQRKRMIEGRAIPTFRASKALKLATKKSGYKENTSVNKIDKARKQRIKTDYSLQKLQTINQKKIE